MSSAADGQPLIPVYVVGTPYADEEIHGVALARAKADEIAGSATSDLSVDVGGYYVPAADVDLSPVLLARFGVDRLRLIAPYLEKRAVDARATSRLDQAAALAELGEAVAAAVTYAEATARGAV